MSADFTRLKITLPRNSAWALNELAGPRDRGLCIAEAIGERIKSKEEKEAGLSSGGLPSYNCGLLKGL